MTTESEQEQEWSPRCAWCGHDQFEKGFVADYGQGSQGYTRWVPGNLDRGLFGGASLMGREKHAVLAHRCTRCQHLALFVEPDPD